MEGKGIFGRCHSRWFHGHRALKCAIGSMVVFANSARTVEGRCMLCAVCCMCTFARALFVHVWPLGICCAFWVGIVLGDYINDKCSVSTSTAISRKLDADHPQDQDHPDIHLQCATHLLVVMVMVDIV